MISATALKSELQTDPTSLGYAALLTAGNHSALADALNLVRAGISIQLVEVASNQARSAFDPADYLAMTANNRTFLNFILTGESLYVSDTVRTWATGAIGNTGGTLARINALLTRTGSRAEKLFGPNVVATVDDIVRALAS